MVGGQRVELFLNAEWARYFDSLNTQVETTSSAVGLPGAPGTTGAAGVGVALSDGESASVEFIPGPRGEQGLQGSIGPAAFMLQEQADAPEWIAPATVADEAFIAPTLLNSWVAFGAPYNAPGYFKDSRGIVHLRGLVKSGTASTIFTLPAGYRPIGRELFAVPSNDLFGACSVDPAGAVSQLVGSNVYFSLDGITFRAAGTY